MMAVVCTHSTVNCSKPVIVVATQWCSRYLCSSSSSICSEIAVRVLTVVNGIQSVYTGLASSDCSIGLGGPQY